MKNEFGKFNPGKRPGEWFRHDTEMGPVIFREQSQSLLVLRTKQVVTLAEKKAANMAEKEASEKQHKDRHALALSKLTEICRLLQGVQIGKYSLSEAKGLLWDKSRSGEFHLEIEFKGIEGSENPSGFWSEGYFSRDFRLVRFGRKYTVEIKATKVGDMTAQVIADIIKGDIAKNKRWNYTCGPITKDERGRYCLESWENAQGEKQERRDYINEDAYAPHTKYDECAGIGAW